MSDLSNALLTMAELKPLAYSAGYTIALYGSVLYDGEGGDVDVIAVKWKAEAAPWALWEVLSRHGWRSLPRSGTGGLHNSKAQWSLRSPHDDSVIVDLQVL